MKEHTGKNKIFIVIIICLCAVIIAGLIYFMKLKGGSDSAFKPDLDSNAKTQTAEDTSGGESKDPDKDKDKGTPGGGNGQGSGKKNH